MARSIPHKAAKVAKFALATGLAATALALAPVHSFAAKVTLSFGGYYSKSGLTAPWSIMQKAIKEYERTHPNIRIQYIDDTGVYWGTKMLTLIAAGQTPDVISLYEPWLMDYADRKLVEPFPETFTSKIRSKFIPAALTSLSQNKRLYALPTEYQVTALLSNSKILREAGIGKVPDTWADLEALANKLTLKDASGRVQRWGLGADLGGWATPALFRVLFDSNGGSFMTKDGIGIDSQAGLKALEDLRKWFFTKKIATADSSTIAKDKCAFTVGYPWHLYFIEAAYKDQVSRNIGVHDMPSGTAKRSAYDYAWGLAISRGSRHKAEAYNFIQWLTTYVAESEGMTYVGAAMASLGSLSAAKVDAGKGKFGKLAAWFGGFEKNTDYALPAYGIGNYQKIDDIFIAELQPVIDGKANAHPASALASAKKRLQTLLKLR